MAHFQKNSRTSVGHLGKHYERGKDESSEYVKFGNQDIKPELSPLNYNLAPEREMGPVNFIKQRTSEVQCLNRADVKVMCSWVVTLPKNFPKDQEREFFEQSYRFLANRYGGEKNVVSAYVHKDESQPHMHFAFVPVVLDQKKGIEKVSAKECVSLRDLKSFHGDMSKHMERHFGRDVGILNEATKEGNKAIEELKRQSAAERLSEAKDIVSQSKAEANQIITQTNERAYKYIEKTKKDVEPLEKYKNDLEGQIEALEDNLKSSDDYIQKIRQIVDMEGKKTMFGDNVILPKEQFDALKKSAIDGIKVVRENDTLKNSNERYKSQNERMSEKFDPINKENMTLKIELRDRRKDYLDLEKKFEGTVERRDAFLDRNGLGERYDSWKKDVWDKEQAIIKAPSIGRGGRGD